MKHYARSLPSKRAGVAVSGGPALTNAALSNGNLLSAL